MTNQGFFGALWQYWNINPKPRLERKNTFFDDELDKVTNQDAIIFCTFSLLIALGILSVWCIIGGLLL